MEGGKRLSWFCRKILNRDVDLNSFNDKLTIQKSVYLARKFGLSFNYDFGWHVKGVYSSDLTVELYSMRDNQSNYSPSQREVEFIEKLQSIERISKDFTSSLELFSTVVYAKKDRGMEKDEEIINFVKRVKPWFTKGEIKKSLQLSRDFA